MDPPRALGSWFPQASLASLILGFGSSVQKIIYMHMHVVYTQVSILHTYNAYVQYTDLHINVQAHASTERQREIERCRREPGGWCVNRVG